MMVPNKAGNKCGRKAVPSTPAVSSTEPSPALLGEMCSSSLLPGKRLLSSGREKDASAGSRQDASPPPAELHPVSEPESIMH